MEKTKLGIPVHVLGAVFYLLCVFGGYIPAILIAGYILIREADENLRTAAVTGVLVMLAFAALNLVLGLFIDLMGMAQTGLLANLVSGVINTFYGIRSFFNWVGDAFLVVLAVMMLVKKPLNLPFIKKILN